MGEGDGERDRERGREGDGKSEDRGRAQMRQNIFSMEYIFTCTTRRVYLCVCGRGGEV